MSQEAGWFFYILDVSQNVGTFGTHTHTKAMQNILLKDEKIK